MAKVTKKITFPAKLTPRKEVDGRYFFTPDLGSSFPFPNLIEVQLNSYKWFVTEGIQELLDEINPIEDATGKKLKLEILNHEIEEPKHEIPYCKKKGLTYESSIRAHVALTNLETGEIKEQDVYFGQIPVITDNGTFVINGIERVIVSQIVRSPGIFFAPNAAVQGSYSVKMIPKRGAWLEAETDKKGLIWVKVDRKRKIPVTMFLRAFGLFKGLVKDETLDPILKTLEKDESTTAKEAWQGVYKRIRPGDLATPDNARNFLEGMFFDYKKYDLGPIARYKINQRFDLKTKSDAEGRIFRIEDFIEMVKSLIRMNEGTEACDDDIDHLSNRRVRGVGELVQNKFRVGLLRTERIVKDRMTIVELDTVTPTQLINCRPITAAMREFFASGQLSQFMDQTNPLAALEHKRRISAMGPGGLSRERASFEVRDVHPSHYGRICPVTTPEGPNIGLVLHLASYAKVNPMEIKDLKNVPVRHFITDEVAYYGAEAEKNMCIAQANSVLDAN